MMKMTAHLVELSLDLKRYKKDLAKSMSDQLKEAIRVWLQAVIRPVVPTWSGASRATFEKIARSASTTIGYGALKAHKDRRSLGKRESEGSITIDKEGLYSFEWSTTLRYFILNNMSRQEYVPGAKDTGSGVIYSPTGLTRPGPYNIEEKSKPVLENFIQGMKLPLLTDYFKRTNIKA